MLRIAIRVILGCIFILPLIARGNKHIAAPHNDSATVRGRALGQLSQVAFYYDSLWSSGIFTKDLQWEHEPIPRVLFVKPWGEWIADEEVYGHSVRDAVVPGDTGDPFSEYAGNAIFNVSVAADLLTINRNARTLNDRYGRVQVKLLSDSPHEALLGVSVAALGDRHTGYIGYRFYSLSQGRWSDVTESVAAAFPHLKAYFQPQTDLRLILKYGIVQELVEFKERSELITVTPYVKKDLDCEDQWEKRPIAYSKRKRRKMCAAVKRLVIKQQVYRFDRGQLRYVMVID